MNIIGDKVVLRAINASDNEMLLEMINDPETERMLGGSSRPLSLENQLQWFNSLKNDEHILRCIVETKESDKAIGTVILSDIDQKNGSAQIHIKLSPHGVRGKGYGTDAINAMVGYAFGELRLHSVYAEVLAYNTVSQKVFEKCSFEKDGVLRSRVYKNGQYVDVISYSIIRDIDL